MQLFRTTAAFVFAACILIFIVIRASVDRNVCSAYTDMDGYLENKKSQISSHALCLVDSINTPNSRQPLARIYRKSAHTKEEGRAQISEISYKVHNNGNKLRNMLNPGRPTPCLYDEYPGNSATDPGISTMACTISKTAYEDVYTPIVPGFIRIKALETLKMLYVPYNKVDSVLETIKSTEKKKLGAVFYAGYASGWDLQAHGQKPDGSP
ncbi:uncharacterized protein NEMAJ01_0699 [Nematocida major]|uniref:uncharacterized protein n=1 Tax=Nematocida major TaxID=1912982 RepID=UPI0020082A50|nr:uncharacterized protein NEMAJ01_0699 [Nematocida major]KAH9385803.1 hypothetical protein NEMAJ01_0699 [Nematocida major]